MKEREKERKEERKKERKEDLSFQADKQREKLTDYHSLRGIKERNDHNKSVISVKHNDTNLAVILVI